jgi:hypothetical protein
VKLLRSSTAEDGGAPMFCSACGNQIPDDSLFCGNCGAPANPASAAPTGQTPSGPAGGGISTPPRAQYVPPRGPFPPPPVRPDRTTLWIALSAAVIILAAAGIAIPLLVRANGDDTSSTTGSVTTATTVVSSTTVSSEPSSSTESVTSSETTATTAAGGDEWVEAEIPDGPWTADEVAVSDEAVLLRTSTGTEARLTAVMLDSGDVIELTVAEAMWGMDIDGDVAVWWEGAAFDDITSMWTEQHIYSFHLPDGPRTEITAGGAVNIGSPQVALPYVTWVERKPWADNPDEYEAERILMTNVNDSGVPTGSATEMVPLALAFIMGDSGWYYSLSRTCLAWENGDAAAGYDTGISATEIDTDSHGSIGPDSWQPSLWQHTLVYYDDGLKITDLSAGGTHDFAPDGNYPAAGPDFAAYYRMVDGGTEIVVRAYDGSYEQVLGTSPDPPWFCPPISVSSGYIAFTIGTEVHLFRWS